jgi:hypothetical protein
VTYGRVLCTSPCPSCPHKGLPRAGVVGRPTGDGTQPGQTCTEADVLYACAWTKGSLPSDLFGHK